MKAIISGFYTEFPLISLPLNTAALARRKPALAGTSCDSRHAPELRNNWHLKKCPFSLVKKTLKVREGTRKKVYQFLVLKILIFIFNII
jgi:hypothetical protein